jgi:hypothetical protein
MYKIKEIAGSLIAVLFILTISLSFPIFQSNAFAAVFFSEDFRSGTFGSFSPLFNPSDPCDATGDVFVDTTDHRPGATDSYSYHIVPKVGDGAACCGGPAALNLGEGKGFFLIFWQKFGSQCQFTSGAGKGPEVRGSSGQDRIVVGPGIYAEPWSIPNPPLTNGYRTALIPVIMNFPASYANGSNWRPFNSCDGLNWTQNINTNNPIYIERGYWYRFKLYVYPHSTNGRIRLWVKRADWNNQVEIIDTDRKACSTLKTLMDSSGAFRGFHPHYCYNDHGGGGANAGFQIWLDDILVTDTDPDLGAPPSPPAGLRIVN